MKIHERCLVFLAVGLLAAFTGAAEAALVPIFEYSFPDSYDGTSTVIDDLADTNDSTMAATGGYEADVRPPGFTSGGSIDGGAGGYGLTDAINLLTNVDVAAAGGFMFDTWVMLDTVPSYFESYQFQFISNCGADALVLHSRKIKATMYDADGTITYIDGPTAVANQWYHLVYQFDTMGNDVDVDGCLAGELSFIIDDVVVGSETLARYTLGSDLDRPIGINCKGQSGDYDVAVYSHLFNPSVSLGIEPPPLFWPGDANNDNEVNAEDAAALAAHWLQAGNWGDGDFNDDGKIDGIDAAMMAANWGNVPGANSAVPEPSALAALAGLLAMLFVRRVVRR